uniref:Uncharacterized protein n=1 Tax=Populus alba TaxID=43335 RepID=A0A4U5QPE9_POPAL|nr:hypothetical protein D5086_0000065550 [Populus alba]
MKWEATEPERDGAVRTLGLRRRRAPEQPFRVFDPLRNLSSLKVFKLQYEPVYRSPIKHMVSDIDLSNLEILPEIVRSFFDQAHDKILDSIAAFLSHFFPLESVTLSDNDFRRLFPELASGNNQTVPEFPREDQPESSSWNDQPLQGLIGNENLMEKLPSLASRNTQQPLPELEANDNLVENLAPSVPSQDDSMNDNDANQHVTITVEAEQLLDAGESSRHRVRTMETTLLRIGEIFLTALFTFNHFLVQEISGWTLLVTNLILEIASAVFDQMGYALIGMVLAFVALLLAAAELIHMAPKERIIWAGMRPILPLHTSATRKPVGTIVEYSGLAGAVWQCVYSTVEYTYTRQEKDNPIKMCLLPFIFLLCVVISKLLFDKRSIDKSS